MTFLEAFEIVKKVLGETGTTISSENYDGIIVKRLEASNTLDEGRTTNQTHIAITGEQMDIFPYLRSDGYFRKNESDPGLKKYFVAHVPVVLFESNFSYLSAEPNDFHFVNGKMKSFVSVVRSKRAEQADQIQVSMINLDGKEFVEFRKLLHAGSVLIILKVKNIFEYHVFGIKNIDPTSDLLSINNKFFKLTTNTTVDINDLVVVNETDTAARDHNLSIEELGVILNEMYSENKGSGQVAAIHMFGFKYGSFIIKNSYSCKKILDAAGMGDTKYDAEISKGVNIYRSVLNNEYGVRFLGQESIIEDILAHNVYGIHIKKETNALSEDDPHICIGWSKLGDLSQIDSLNDLSDIYTSVWPESKAKSKGQSVGQIYRFIKEAQIGDYVVYGDGAKAHIGVITSDYYYDENPTGQDPDYVNNRRVSWIKKGIDYSKLSLQFKNSLGSAMSFFRLNDYRSVIADLVNDVYKSDDIANAQLEGEEYNYNLAKSSGENLVVYGTPGCGKSYYVDHTILGRNEDGEYVGEYKKDNIIRTTFYLDYTNTDFIGQIVPVIEYEDGDRSTVTYKFVPGPFAIALECAFANPTEKVALVIEELNRGNAPCIFGDLFQLLDRIDEGGKDFPIGTSEYGILNTSLVNYLKDNEHYNKKYTYSFDLDEIRIPANLSIYATMNTSDQNVFTLDTAFKRRWGFEKLSNKFDDSKKGKHPYKDYFVPGLQQVTWKSFVNAINNYIVRDNDLLTSEDKQLGVYFVTKKMLIDPSKKDQYTKDELKKIIDKFAYKVFEYLWDDVAKFSRDKWFGNIRTLDELIKKYVNEEKVFADDIFQQ